MIPPIDGTGELHHVSVVVPSIPDALPFYRDTLRMRAGPVRELPEQHVRAVFLTALDTRIELIEPTDGTSGVARFLAERGKPALHHLCFVVDDLRATPEVSSIGSMSSTSAFGAERKTTRTRWSAISRTGPGRIRSVSR